MISCQILGFSDTFKILLFFSVRVTKILISISLAANLQENSITPKEMIIYLTVQNNTQGNRYFSWRLRITLEEILVFLAVQDCTQGNFLGDSQKPPRKHPYSLAVYFNLQGIYVSLRVHQHLQGNYIFLNGLILALKEIPSTQGNSSFLQ